MAESKTSEKGGMKVFRATLSYDGTNFHGVAEQVLESDVIQLRTVVGELRDVVEMVSQAPVYIAVSGRTDKGVHAREQIVSFTFDEDIEINCERLKHVCNQRLNPEIVVHELAEVRDDFHARHSAKSRTYRYFIDNSSTPHFLMSKYAWSVSRPLDIDAMKNAAKYFVGEQDFTSVCRTDNSKPHNIREVFSAEFTDIDLPEMFSTPNGQSNVLCFEISANAFCWQMVRSIVGILVEVGKGKLSPDDIPALLEKKERAYGSRIAPAHGLILWKVDY